MASQTQNPKDTRQRDKFSRQFVSQPSESDLSIPFLEGLGATSDIGDESRNGNWRIFPKPIPLKGVAIWMYSCGLVIFPLIIFFVAKPADRWSGIVLCIAGSLFCVPAMMAMLYYANEAIGTEDYLRFDEKNRSLELPRMPVSFLADQVCEVVSIRFGDRVQTSVLIVETNQTDEVSPCWTLYYVCDICGSRDWLGVKLAKQLNLKCKSFRYSNREYRELLSCSK